jgi:hypothetical protein
VAYEGLTCIATLENGILDDWNRHDRADILSHRQIGRKWFRRFHPAPALDPVGTEHFFVPRHLPDPTVSDIMHVNNQPFLPGTNEWRFERTMYQNAHLDKSGGILYRRILDLFTRVDDFGRVIDVSVYLDPH